LYKEDFNKFIKGLNEAVDYVKTELMPDFDFDAFNHEDEFSSGEEEAVTNTINAPQESPNESVEKNESENNGSGEEVDKW
jgi:hypothetical protein